VRRRRKITVETRQLLVIHKPKGITYAWCVACAGQVEMISAEQAAVIADVSLRAICRWVDAERLHFKEDANGMLSICLNSLLQSIQI